MDRTFPARSIRYLILLASALLGFGVFTSGVLAKRSPDAPVAQHKASPTVPNNDAFMELVPEPGAPSNGGTVDVGYRFVLDLWLNAGSHQNVIVQQSYLLFTSDYLKNVRVDQITSTCILTSTVTADRAVFESELQNEVCNGMAGSCTFPNRVVEPGSFAFASGALTNCPEGCSGYFRVARVGFCAVAPGDALLHWQFSPPAPVTRDTEIMDIDSHYAHDPSLFNDYAIHINGGGITVTTQLVGHVNWYGRPAQPSARQQFPITLTLKLGTTEVNYPEEMTDARGYFTVPVTGLPAGTYTWRARGSAHLASTGTIFLMNTSVTQMEMGQMIPGDANNDNVVTMLDFGYMRWSSGRSIGEPGFEAGIDLNGDNVVNIADLNIFRSVCCWAGAPPIIPREP